MLIKTQILNLVAARCICSIGGGLAVAYNGQIIANLGSVETKLLSDMPNKAL
jgi:hypothetical protein